MGIFNNKENEKKSFEQTIESLKSDYAQLEQENAVKDKEIEQLKRKIEELSNSNSDTTSEQTIITLDPVEKNEPSTSDTTTMQVPDYAQDFEAIKVAIGEVKELAKELRTQVAQRDAQDENMKEMHKELEKFRSNFYAKITQPYLMAMLDMHKRFFESYAHFDHLDNTEADIAQLYNDLMGQFKSAIDALEGRIYNDFGIEYYLPQVGEEFNPKIHQAFEITTTGIESNDKKIAKVIYGGFRDIDTERILRPARVACYKYQLIIE